MGKFYAFFFIAILLAVSARPQSDEYFYSSSMVLDLKLHSDFTLSAKSSSPRLDYAKAELHFFPTETPNQRISSIFFLSNITQTDESIVFFWKNPAVGKYEYGFDSEIETNNDFVRVDQKVPFPLLNLPPEAKEYLEPSEKIDITPEIIAQASELAEGEDDAFKVIFNLASWTKKNINYSLDTFTADASQKSSWVLANKYGVCDELTNLFIAMNRALGIPARFVSGVSYTNSELFEENWGLHGWAEVYLPGYGWIPVDPTYGQYGQVDATHIKLRESVDSDKSSTKFEWEASGVDLIPGELKTEVRVIKAGPPASLLADIEITPMNKEIAFGSHNLITVYIKNKEDYYIGFDMQLNKPKEVSVIGDKSKFIVLGPHESRYVYYIVKVYDDLMENYLYTFPVSIQTSIGSSAQGSFKSRQSAQDYSLSQITELYGQIKEQETKIYSKNLQLICSDLPSIYANESFRIDCRLENKGNIFLKGLRVCLDSQDCQQIDLGITQARNISFSESFSKIGSRQITLTAKNSDVSVFKAIKLNVLDKPDIMINSLEYPESTSYSAPFDVKFNILKQSVSKPNNVTVFFYFNDKMTKWNPDLETSQGFDVSIGKSLLYPANNTFTVIVIYHDNNGNEYSEKTSRDIGLENLSLPDKFQLWMNKILRVLEKIIVG